MKITFTWIDPNTNQELESSFHCIAEAPKISYYSEVRVTNISVANTRVKVLCSFGYSNSGEPADFWDFFRQKREFITKATLLDNDGNQLIEGKMTEWKENRTDYNIEISISSDMDDIFEEGDALTINLSSNKLSTDESLEPLINDIHNGIFVKLSEILAGYSITNVGSLRYNRGTITELFFDALNSALFEQHGQFIGVNPMSPSIPLGDFVYQFEGKITLLASNNLDNLKGIAQLLNSKIDIVGNNIYRTSLGDVVGQYMPGQQPPINLLDGWIIDQASKIKDSDPLLFTVDKAEIKLTYPAQTYTYNLHNKMNVIANQTSSISGRETTLEGFLNRYVLPSQIVVYNGVGYRILDIDYDGDLLLKGIYYAKIRAITG